MDYGAEGVRFVKSRGWLQTELDDTKFCYQLIITFIKFVIYKALFLNKTQEIPRFFFGSCEKKSHLSMHVMTRTVLFRLKSGQLIGNQIWEFCDGYDYNLLLLEIFDRLSQEK